LAEGVRLYYDDPCPTGQKLLPRPKFAPTSKHKLSRLQKGPIEINLSGERVSNAGVYKSANDPSSMKKLNFQEG
jgi:hypothetical protein